MRKFSISTGCLAVGLLLSACVTESGFDNRSTEYGVSVNANIAAQDAYNLSNQRLIDLGRDFSSNATDTVTFAFNSARLDGAARRALDTQIRWLKANKSVRMTIVGHTDLVGSRGYNKGLGLRRARAALRYMNRRGISRKRLAAIASRGELEPVVETTARERRNRRTVTTVSGLVRNYVGIGLDGVYSARVYDTFQAGDNKVGKANASEAN